MTDRVRLLLEDGTVLAEGVRPTTVHSRAVTLENRKRAARDEQWRRVADGNCGDCEWRGPVSVSPSMLAWRDHLLELAKEYMPGGTFYAPGFTSVIKL